jgi:chorismate mutase/prephenate dehydratase
MMTKTRIDLMGLAELRNEIDRIDRQMVDLLNERVRNAVMIGEEKRKNGVPVQDPVRENEVLDKVKSLNNGPLADEAIETLYRVIIETCLAFQKTMETDA